MTISRHKPFLMGYFQFLIDNPEVMKSYFYEKNIFITKHFNKVGGTRLLSTLPKEYFYEELTNIKSRIQSVTSGKQTQIEDEDIFE